MKLLITGGSGFIGTNFIDLIRSKGILEFINIDKQKPLKESQVASWRECNILDLKRMTAIFDEYKPTHVLHLAARTDTASEKLIDYNDNTTGTQNLLKIIEMNQSVERIVITSTQYVYKSLQRQLPASDTDFKPHTAYGESKMLTEMATREANLKCAWTIIRPTNVWGPWHMRYPNELLRIIDKGLYFHPRHKDPLKSYAYVKNVAHQILEILNAPLEQIDRKVFYVGDMPMRSIVWTNAFAKQLTGKAIKFVPAKVLQLASYVGTFLHKLKLPFPLSRLRYENMTTDYDTPMQKTIDAFGLSHPEFEENVNETLQWIKGEGSSFFHYWKEKSK